MRTFFTIILFFGLGILSHAQGISLKQKIKVIPGHYQSFSIDNLDNIYLLSNSNLLKKYNADGDSVSVFNEVKKYGQVSLIDVSNPLKILLYYKGFSTIAILDGMLNLKNKIDLRRKGIFNASAAGLSYDGKIWLYDEAENVLKKLDDEGNTIFKTADFRQLFSKALNPVKIFDQNQFIYMYDPLQGIYVFDYYGTYKNKIDITNWNHLNITNKYITGTGNKKLFRYDISSLQTKNWSLPAELSDFTQIFLKNDLLYILEKEGLTIYLTEIN